MAKDNDDVIGPESTSPIGKDYTEPVKLPLWFKQKLERIQQKANHDRKQKDKKLKNLPIGWFIVDQLTEWLNRTAAEIDQEESA